MTASYRSSHIVAELASLREEWNRVRSLCWSDSTIRCKKSQWKQFFKFCAEFELSPLPVDEETVCLYITHLTARVCYVTITQYVSAIWMLHRYLGYAHPDPSCFIIQSTLKGAKRLLGAASLPALPLTPANMISIFRQLDMSILQDLRFWCALVLAFRCLLRVGHLTSSPHVLCVKDVEFNSGGMDVVIRSSKTVQYRERINRIPVVESPGSILCPVGVLKTYLSITKKSPSAPIFGYTYNSYATKFKSLCRVIGLQGHYSTHSVRRGSASYLATFLPLHDVKSYGDWRSWAVLLYLSDTYESRVVKDKLVATNLAKFN